MHLAVLLEVIIDVNILRPSCVEGCSRSNGYMVGELEADV